MAKELPYFKFEVSEWMFGRIQKRTPQAQAAFINLCCKYWHKLGQVSLRSAQMDFGLEEITELIDAEIIYNVNGNIAIKFLDEQLGSVKDYLQKQSQKGKLSAEKRRRNKEEADLTDPEPELNNGSTAVQPVFNSGSTSVQPDVNLIREEKRIEEKKGEESDLTPNQAFGLRFKQSPIQIQNGIRVLRGCKLFDSEKNLIHLLRQFVSTLDARGENKPNYKDFSSHFISWIPHNGAKFGLKKTAQ